MASYATSVILRTGACWVTLLLSITAAFAANPEREIETVDSVMFFDPELPKPVFFHDRTDAPVSLWLKALSRPDAELRRVVIDTFALAHRRNMSGIEVVVDELVQLLRQADQNAAVRRASVRALIQFDQSEHAPLLAALSAEHGGEIAKLVEPALAHWKSDELSQAWLHRLADPMASEQSLVDAIVGLAALRNTEAKKSLLGLAMNPLQPLQIQLEAGDALGQIFDTGLEESVARLLSHEPPKLVSDLVAVRMLASHQSEQAIHSLKVLAKRSETAVQAEALGRLFEIDPALLIEFSSAEIDSPDVNVRRLIARSLILAESQSHIPEIASLLDDVNPSLRTEIAEALIRLADADTAPDAPLRTTIIEETSKVLQREPWRGCEQAIIVLVNLKHHPASSRFVELLHHERGEVMIAAGWGLRRFALKEHLPRMLDRAKEIYQGFISGGLTLRDNGPEGLIAQLFMAFGQMKYEPADDLMRQYIPKQLFLGDNSRPAAFWALGYLYEDDANAELTQKLVSRMKDEGGQSPETDHVRRMAAIALGRMGAKNAVGDLQSQSGRGFMPTSLASEWSIEQITGEKIPEPDQPPLRHYTDWFLMPFVDQP